MTETNQTNKTSLHWSIEGPNNTCPTCGDTAVPIVAKVWDCCEDDDDSFPDGLEVNEEIAGHYCPVCRKLVSLSFISGEQS